MQVGFLADDLERVQFMHRVALTGLLLMTSMMRRLLGAAGVVKKPIE
jgi:hypothetical protein